MWQRLIFFRTLGFALADYQMVGPGRCLDAGLQLELPSKSANASICGEAGKGVGVARAEETHADACAPKRRMQMLVRQS